MYEKYNGTSSYVAISDSDRNPRLQYLATIHHGIDTDAFSLHSSPGGYLLFFGRIHPEKGAAKAIEVSRRVGLPLVMAGIIQDRRYFDEEVGPYLDGQQTRFLGAVGPDQRRELLGGAAALLHLISFDEPFGFSVVEAMASGTPVIAFRRGSMPELIADGQTGFLVGDVQEAVQAIKHLEALDRPGIRAQAVTQFGRDRMVDDYLKVYSQVTGWAGHREAGGGAAR